MTKISKVLIDHWYKVGDGTSGGNDSGGGSTSNPGGSLIPDNNLPIEEGEYDIAQVKAVNMSGALTHATQTQILSQDKTHVWYQRQGKFARFVIRCEATAQTYSSYNNPLFSASDLIGDGKIVPASQDPSFAEAIATVNVGAMPLTISNVGFVTPSCGFVKSANSATAGDYLFLAGSNTTALIPYVGNVCVISGTVVW